MSSPLIPRGRGAYQAFTLIELLAVIAIIGVLAGITFGVVDGVRKRAAISRAKSELAILAQALEGYKRQYGDYPMVQASVESNEDATVIPASPLVTDRAYFLYQALAGYMGPTRIPLQREVSMGGAMRNKYGKSFIDSSKFTLERRANTDAPAGERYRPEPAAIGTNDPRFINALLDPWGNRYLYYYKDRSSPASWKNPSYVLLSAGPDGVVKFTHDFRTTGALSEAFYTDVETGGTDQGKGNPDNLYSNR